MYGSWSNTRSLYCAEVTTKIFSGLQSFKKRLQVLCKSVCPVPSTSKNCLGLLVLLMGQNLLPTPPAIIMQYKFFIMLNPTIIFSARCAGLKLPLLYLLFCRYPRLNGTSLNFLRRQMRRTELLQLLPHPEYTWLHLLW